MLRCIFVQVFFYICSIFFIYSFINFIYFNILVKKDLLKKITIISSSTALAAFTGPCIIFTSFRAIDGFSVNKFLTKLMMLLMSVFQIWKKSIYSLYLIWEPSRLLKKTLESKIPKFKELLVELDHFLGSLHKNRCVLLKFENIRKQLYSMEHCQ